MTRRAPAALGWLAGILVFYLAAPFVAGVGQIGLADWRSAEWGALRGATLVSVLSASLATGVVAMAGVPLGYLLARRPGGVAAGLGFLVQLPLALPPLASGVLLLFLFGYTTPLGRLAGGTLTDSFTGIVLAEIFVAAPFLVIAARSAFSALDPVLEDVAATLGHGPRRAFLRVSLPLVWRPLVAGALMCWLRAFGEFGATVMVAYHPYSLPVYTYVAFGSEGLPAMLPVLVPTLAAAVVVMAVAALLGRRRPPGRALAEALAAPAVTGYAAPPEVPRTLDLVLRRPLDGFCLDIAWRVESRRLAILGASGSGKSMTLRLIAGLDAPGGARVVFGGTDLSSLPPERRSIAYVPQNYGLFPHLTVRQQARFGRGCDPAVADRWVAALGLQALAARRPTALSLGQQQRVALARALARPSDIVLLDEPFSALDAPLRARLGREFRALQDRIAATTILVTHDPEEAFLLADTLLLLEGGRVLQAGPVAEVFTRPASAAAARLLGAETGGTGQVVTGTSIALGGGATLVAAGRALPPGALVGWAVRPDRIRLDPAGAIPAMLLVIGPAIAGRHEMVLGIGESVVNARCELGGAVPGPCRVAIAPEAVQVWVEKDSRKDDLPF